MAPRAYVVRSVYPRLNSSRNYSLKGSALSWGWESCPCPLLPLSKPASRLPTIATAIPYITDQFKNLNDVGWYGSVYLLTTCAFQLLYGKLYKFFSIKWVFLSGLFIFEVGSLICGVAPNSISLIVGSKSCAAADSHLDRHH